MIDAEKDDRQFRRGVVLGLTMAEILLLLIFVLLILLVARLTDEQALAADAARARDLAEQRIDDLQSELAIIQRQVDGSFDITKEYVRIEQELAAAEQRLAEAAPGLELLEEAQAAAPGATAEEASAEMVEAARIGRQVMAEMASLSPAAGPQEALDNLMEEAETGRAVMEQAQASDPSATPEEALQNLMRDAAAGRQTQLDGTQDLLSDLDYCKSTLQNCEGQTAFLNDRLNAQGGGFGKKPCWVTPDGAIEYIFGTRLTDAGIIVNDYALPHRAADQGKLPLAGIAFGVPLEDGTFRRAFLDLYNWSTQNDCRFVVDVFDETGPQKDRYKALLDAVKDNFFIRERG